MSRLGTYVLAGLLAAAGQLPSSDNCDGAVRPAVSPDGRKTACFAASGGVVITSSGGVNPVQAVLGQGVRGCHTPVRLEWIDGARVGALCEAEPSLDDYFVVNAQSGNVEGEYAGAWFAWSPDGRVLAHAGVLEQYATPAGEEY